MADGGGGGGGALLTHRQLLSLAAGLVGLQFCWAVQVGYVTKTILQLGLAGRWMGVVWLAGPIAGIVVQPLVGVASDACTSPFGRRRPFIVAGSVLTVMALTSFAYAGEIGGGVGVSPLVVAVASFWALDFAINAAQGPLRALMADLAPPEQQTEGNAYFAFGTGVGNVVGGALGSLPLSKFLPFFDDDGQALYMIAALALIVCVSCLVANTSEKPMSLLATSTVQYSTVADNEETGKGLQASFELADASSGMSASSSAPLASANYGRDPTCDLPPSATFYAVFAAAPRDFHLAFAMQCFTWFAYFSFFIFATSYMGAEVFQGTATAAKDSETRALYDAGVRLGNFALAMQAAVSMAFSLIVPMLVTRYTAQNVLFASHVILGTVLASTLFLHSYNVRYMVVIGFALIGIPWAVTMTVPWGMASTAVLKSSPERAGQYCTLLCCSLRLRDDVSRMLAASGFF